MSVFNCQRQCQCHAENILQQLWQDCENEELCDIVLIAGNDETRIPAHRNILSAASEYFKRMFQSSMRESTTKEMPSVNGDILRSLVEYCYIGHVTITEDNAMKLLKFADFLLLSNVVTTCGTFLSEQLHPTNCLGLALFAEQHRCELLLKKAKDYSLEHFMDVAKSQEFLNLNSEQLGEFLACDNICVSDEENVFEILMTWMQYDLSEREKHKDQLLKLVRLPLIERWFLIKEVKPICTSIESLHLYIEALERNSLSNHKIINARKSINSEFLICLTREFNDSRMQINFFCPQRLQWMRWLKDFECPFNVTNTAMHDDIYFLGGKSKGNVVLNTVFSINLKTMTIGQINPMIERRMGFKAIEMNGILYAVGGHDGRKSISSVEKWDPKTNTWTKVASMLERRHSFCIERMNSRLYAVGGYCDNNALSSGEYYDIHQNVWKSIAPMNECSQARGVAVANNLLFVVDTCSDTVKCYDSRCDKWTIICSLPIKNYEGFSRARFCNKLSILCDDKCYEYNDKTNEWESKEIFNGINNVYYRLQYSGELLTSEFIET